MLPFSIVVKNGPGFSKRPERFVKKPVIVFVQDFDETGYRKFCAKFSQAEASGQGFVPIIINSYGGYTYDLFGMLNVIKHSKVPVYTYTGGKAMSCAAVLLSAGTKGCRYIGDYGTVLVHEVSSSFEGKSIEVKNDAEETQRLNKVMLALLDKNCGQKSGFFEKEIHKKGHTDLFYNAVETKKIGLVDKIGRPEIVLEIDSVFLIK